MEHAPQPERLGVKSRLLEAIRANGLDDPRTKELYLEWMDGRIAEIESIPNSEKERYVRAQIELNCESAEFYFEGGQLDVALEAFGEALEQAMQEGFDQTASDIAKRIKMFSEKREQ
jgi:hypothetical protein